MLPAVIIANWGEYQSGEFLGPAPALWPKERPLDYGSRLKGRPDYMEVFYSLTRHRSYIGGVSPEVFERTSKSGAAVS